MKRKSKNVLISLILIVVISVSLIIVLLKKENSKIDIANAEIQKYKDSCDYCNSSDLTLINSSASGGHDWMCNSCGETMNHGHWDDKEQKIYAATSGCCYFTRVTCTLCGYYYDKDKVDHTRWKSGRWQDSNGVWHDYVTGNNGWDESGEASCTTGTNYERECYDCGYVESGTNPPLGHNYQPVDSNDGKTHQYICTRCKDVEKTENHIYGAKTTISPTCISDGGENEVCTKCKYTHKLNVLKATGHKYGIGTD